MTDKPEVKRCAACGTEKPVSEMKICMHAQMHRYVCDMKCMNDFYNPPPKPVKTMTDSPRVFGIVDKHRAAGVMLITHGQDSLKDGDKLIRLTDHEAAMSSAEPAGSYQRGYDEGRSQGTRHRVADIQQLEAARAADKARIADLVEALRAFTGAACPCAIQINPKGYSWSGAYLDEALKIAAPLLAQQGKAGGE